MTGLRVKGSSTRTRKVIPDGISQGILSSRGPSTPGWPVWPAMKEMQLSFGILMTDFLEAVLREMASSVPVALLCQSSSPHTSQLQGPRRMQAATVTPGKTRQMEVRRALWVTGNSTYNPKKGTSVHPPSSFLPYSRTKFKRNHSNAVARACVDSGAWEV